MENYDETLVNNLIDAFSKLNRMNLKKHLASGFKHGEIAVLFCIKRHVKFDSEGIKISDISSILNVAAPTVTQLMNGLEEHGLIQRTMDKEDRRAVRVKMTEKGEESISGIYKAFFKRFKGLTEFLGEAETLHLTALLIKVSKYMEEKRSEHC